VALWILRKSLSLVPGYGAGWQMPPGVSPGFQWYSHMYQAPPAQGYTFAEHLPAPAVTGFQAPLPHFAPSPFGFGQPHAAFPAALPQDTGHREVKAAVVGVHDASRPTTAQGIPAFHTPTQPTAPAAAQTPAEKRWGEHIFPAPPAARSTPLPAEPTPKDNDHREGKPVANGVHEASRPPTAQGKEIPASHNPTQPTVPSAAQAPAEKRWGEHILPIPYVAPPAPPPAKSPPKDSAHREGKAAAVGVYDVSKPSKGQDTKKVHASRSPTKPSAPSANLHVSSRAAAHPRSRSATDKRGGEPVPPLVLKQVPQPAPHLAELSPKGNVRFASPTNHVNGHGAGAPSAQLVGPAEVGSKYDSDDEEGMAGKMLPRGATIFFESTDHEPKAVNQTGATPSPPNKVTGLDDFELIRVLGKGAFGKVWKVRRKGNGREYAMKVMSKRHFAKENMVDLLKGEQETLARVRHPYLVGLRWAWQTSDRAFLVMDYMPGGELLGHLNRRPQRRFPEAWAKVYAAQVTLALEHLHGLNILYRDMKPDNVVLDADGNAMLIDFGLALALPPHTKEGGRRYFGKPNYYLSPEMIRGEPFGLEADWWMFGVMLYELLTGTLPWMGALPTEVHRMIISPLYPVRVEQGVCSPAAVDFLTALLCKDLNRRMCTVAAVKAHPWFADISWEKLAAKQVPAPFRPPPEPEDEPAYPVQTLSFCRVPTQGVILRGFSFTRTNTFVE